MPKITLRAYNREIGGLIDRGLTDEAVAHCQYILQTYPKHLDTYRLLGKAYLEAHRHKEAIDLFQRVLAVVPDDFVTHVGMSIIRGEEGDLDAAIWHMERAFEVQPSNQAIQDELKHLYGKRDGQEPQKIRLTRGALCRMYARGNQNRQAIAEIKSILHETPDRPDLEVLLARMYYLSGMVNEAITLAQKILEKLPFCYDTNLLMVEILLSQGKMKEADFYHKKLVALDPYEETVLGSNLTVDQIPDDAIFIEKFFYDSQSHAGEGSGGEEAAPDWLANDMAGIADLGAQGFTKILDAASLPQEQSAEGGTSSTQPVVTEPVDETLPSWLQESEGAKPEKDADIPDFLKSTGWASAGTITEDTPPAQVIKVDDEPAQEGEITPGEIPDWLQSMAPGDAAESTAQPPASDEASFTEWLSGLDQKSDTEKPAHAEPALIEEKAIEPEAEPPQEKPAEVAPVYTQVLELSAEEQALSPAEIPDWLQEISPDIETSQAEKGEEWQPDQVMDEGFPIAGGTSILSPEDVPDWLQEMPSAGETTTQPPQAQIPIPPVEPTSSNNEVVTVALTPEEKEKMPDWLADIQQEVAPVVVKKETEDKVRTAVLPEDEREEVEQMPDWLHLLDQDEKPIMGESAPAAVMPEIPAQAEEEPVAPEPEITPEPSLFIEEEETQAVETAEDKPTTSILPPDAEEAAEELPEWLKEIDSSEGTSPVEMAAATGADEFPDWLKGYSAPPPESPLPPAEPAPEPVISADVPSWLDGLDITEAAESSTETGVPDWMDDIQGSVETGEEPGALATTGELPEWLQDEKEAPVPAAVTSAETEPEAIAETPAPASEETMEEMPSMAETAAAVVEETPAMETEETVGELAITEEPAAEAAQPGEAGETESPESILKDAGAAAAAAAIGIPLFAERAANAGVTESLSRNDMEGFAEEPAAETADVSAETEAEVSAALEEIMTPAEEPVAETEAEVEPAAEPEPEPVEQSAPELVEEPQSEPVSEAEPEPQEAPQAVPVAEIPQAAEKASARKVAAIPTGDYQVIFDQALSALDAGDIDNALPALTSLVASEQKLHEVIQVVDAAIHDNPTDFNLWVILGDAHGRNGDLQEALDAYTKAEEYLQ